MSISRIPHGAAVAGTPRRIQAGIPRPNMIKPSMPIERSVTAKQIRAWARGFASSTQAAVVELLIADLGLE